MRMKRDSQKGFTMIELVLVIVILGVLAAVALPIFRNMRKDAVRAVANGELAALRAAANIYAANRVVQSLDFKYPGTRVALEAELQYPLTILTKGTIETSTWDYKYTVATGKVEKSGVW